MYQFPSVHFLCNFAVRLDESHYIATTCWLVETCAAEHLLNDLFQTWFDAKHYWTLNIGSSLNDRVDAAESFVFFSTSWALYVCVCVCACTFSYMSWMRFAEIKVNEIISSAKGTNIETCSNNRSV